MRVIRSKYRGLSPDFDEGGNRVRRGSRAAESSWWREILDLYGEEGQGGSRGDFKRVLGNGESIYFWKDVWVENEPLCLTFNRLYMLSEQKNERVSELRRWVEMG